MIVLNVLYGAEVTRWDTVHAKAVQTIKEKLNVNVGTFV